MLFQYKKRRRTFARWYI